MLSQQFSILRMLLRHILLGVLIITFYSYVNVYAQIPNQAMQKNNGQSMDRQDNAMIAIPLFTAECWVKAQSRIVIVSRDYPACPTSDWSMVYDYSRQRIEFMTQINSQPDQYFWSPDNSLNAGLWNHVALVANGPGGYANVYINGSLSLTANFSSRNFNATTGLAWGGYYPTGGSGSAYIDEARYWNVERSQSQIQNAKDCKLALNDRQGLVGYWMFCGDFADSSGNGFHGTPRGNPQIVDIVDLPLCLACTATPLIMAAPLQFRTVLCSNEAPRDSVVWVKNVGNANLIINLAQIVGPNESDFTLISPVSIPPILTILPHDSVAFVIRFNPGGNGNRSASLILASNASNGSGFTIQLSGRKENTTFTYSPNMVHYGELQPSQVPKLDSIRITNSGTFPMTITRQSFSPQNGFILLTNLPLTIQPGNSIALIIQFVGPGDGVYKSLLVLGTSPCDSAISIPIVASISRSISFRKIICVNDQPHDTSVVIHNYSDAPLTITRTTVSGTNATEFSVVFPLVPPTLEIPPNDSLTCTIRYDPGLVGSHTAMLNIDYLNPDGGTLHIPLTGMKETSLLTLNKTILDFGQSQPNQLPKSDGVIIKNNGTTQISITQNSFTIGSGYKILTSLPFNLSPGEEKLLKIKFDSSVTGVYQSVLKLRTIPCDSIFISPVIGNIISPITFNTIQCVHEDSRDTSITIHNFSDDILEFISASFTGQDKNNFELIYPSLPPKFTIPAGDSVTLIIRFHPLSNGIKSSVLNIDYSCIVDGTLQISFSGQKKSSAFTLDPSILDFGVLRDINLPARKYILIQNTGTLPLTIQRIELTPPDTFIVRTTLPITIQPGNKDTIWIEFNPRGDGNYHARAVVHDSPCDDTTVISIIGTKRYEPRLSASPLVFESVICNDVRSSVSILMLKNTGTDTLEISGGQIIGTNASDFTLYAPATIPPMLYIAPGDSLPIQIRFTPSAAGDRSASLHLTTNSIDSNSYVIPLSGRKEDIQLSVNPTLLDFGNNQTSDLPKEQKIIIANPGSIDRIITQANLLPLNAFTIVTALPLLIPAHGSQSILIRFDTNTDGIFTSLLKITLSPCDTVIEIQVKGARVNLPFISTNVPVFNTLLCDNEIYRDTIITIINIGSGDLIITGANMIGVDSTSFILLTPIVNQMTISSGDSLPLRVRFSPIKTGISTAVLRIESNASNGSAYDIILQGRKEKILLSPSLKYIDLGILCPDEKSDSAFTIRNIGTISTTANIESETPIIPFPASFVIDTLQTGKIGFSFNGMQQEGAYAGNIRIRNQCDVIDTVQVRAMIAAPKIIIDPLVLSKNGLSVLEGEMTIRNIGLRQMTVTQYALDDSHFIIVSPQLPFQIDTNSTIKVLVRYTPTDTASIQTTFHLQGNPCAIAEQSIVVVSNATQRLISVNAASHGTLQCEVYRDTSIIIRNIGLLPIEISKAQITGVNATDFQLINPASIPPSFIILPNDQRSVQIRFQPQSAGLRTAQLDITSDATNTPFISLPLSGRKENTQLTFSDSLVDFGTICSRQTIRKTIFIHNPGSITQRLSISVKSPFTSNASSVTLLPGQSDSIDVSFDGNVTEGFYSSTLVVHDECAVDHKIPFTTFVIEPRLTSNPVSFSCLVDSFDVQDVRLHNPTSQSIQITSWNIPDSRLVVLSPALPQLIPSNADLLVRIKYSSSYPDSFATTLQLSYLPCTIASQVAINAQSYEAAATVTLPMVAAGVDTMVSIPMNLIQTKYIPQSGATSWMTQISFNRTLLLPVAVHTNSSTASARILSNRTNDSNRVIEIAVDDISSPTDGVILYLDCITGLGNAERTSLNFDQFLWTNGRVKTSTINGEFISTGICREGGARLLQIPFHVQLFQNYPNPFSMNAGSTISFSISNDPASSEKWYHVDLKIFDMYGRMIATLTHEELPPGEYKYRLNQKTLSEGVYIYQLRVENSFITKFMTVIR